MEKLSEENHPQEIVSAKEVKEHSSSDVPADKIEDNRDVESDSESSSESSSDSSSSSDSDSDSEFECDICEKTFSSYLPFKQHLKGKKHAKAVLKKKREKKLMKIKSTNESEEEHFIQEPYAECKICNKEFGGPESYEQHLRCRKHKQKVLVSSILEQVQEEGKINADKLQDLYKNKQKADSVLEETKEKITSLPLEDEDEEKEDEFECKECENTFSGLIPYTQHLTSKTHAKKVEKKKLLHKVIPGTSNEDENSEISKKNTLCIEDDILICKVCSTSFSGPENAVVHMKSKKHAKNLDKYLRKLERKKEKKQSKDSTDFNSGQGKKMKPENENHDEATKEKSLPTSDGSGKSDVSKSSENSTVNSSTSSNQANEELIAREKYKEYKAIMNSLQEGEMMK